MMKRKRTMIISSALIIVSISAVFLINTLKAQGRSGRCITYVTVQEGDTLWSIAKENCKNYRDIRKAIYSIKKLNNIDSGSINPGQKIKLPSEYN